MKAVFFNSKPESQDRVYNADAKRVLKELYGVDDKVYSQSDFGKVDFSETEYLFSTWGMPAVTEEEIAANFPNLRAVFYAAGSVQNFARPFLARGVRVFSAWQANAVPVVEYTVAEIILANKGFFRASRMTRENYKEAKALFKAYPGNYRTRVGIIGDGAIGSRVIDRLRSYELDLYVFSITMTEEQAAARGVHLASLREIFSTCDVISNHLANNEHTKGMLNAELIGLMKPNSTLINTGRGAQIDEAALIEKLRSDESVTAVLDVTDPEPPVEGSPFYTLPNAVLTPHSAGSNGQEVWRMAEYMIEESRRFTNGEETRYEVMPAMLETMA